MIGREQEIAALCTGLRDSCESRGRFFLLVGEAGIGKSTVAREIVNAAVTPPERMLVLHARGFDGEGAPSYWPFIQVFRSLSATCPKAKDVVAILLAESSAAPARSRFELFDAAAQLLRAVSTEDKPILIVLDDLHAVDPSSLSMLNFLGRELTKNRVMFLGSYRLRETRGIDLEVELAKLAREATVLELARLDKDAVTKIIAEAKGMVPPVIADLVFRTSEGVPLFVEEILRTMSTPGAAWLTGAPLPAGVQSVIHDRLMRLDDDTRGILEIASVVGRTFTLALLSILARDKPVHEIVERAVAADVVFSTASGRYAFSHAMTREALYRKIPGGQRAKYHALLVSAFESGEADASASSLSERAYHGLRAAPVIGVNRAVALAEAAADEAMKLHAFEDAADLLRRTLALLDIAPLDAAARTRVNAALHRATNETPTPQSQPAPPPSSSQRSVASLTHEGDIWRACFGSVTIRVKDSRGLQMLAQLIERPGEEIHALTLSTSELRPRGSGPAPSDAGEVLDREAITAYRERLLECEEELREAEGWNDPTRMEHARSELEFLRTELARAVGLGGRSRRANADTERARVNCQRRLRDAIRRITEHDAQFGKHLLRAVKTGMFCAYLPAEAD